MSSRSEAHRAADRRYKEKKTGAGRFPGVMLNQEVTDLLNEMGALHGGKTEAIIKGLRLLKESGGEGVKGA